MHMYFCVRILIVVYRVCNMDYGLWFIHMDYGLWITDYGVCILNSGL